MPFVLTWNPSHESPPKPVDAEHALRDTLRFWTDWTQRGTPVHGPYRDAIKRSLLTLKALTYHPTGGIVAAATTSLPELIGGTRNWDYRYCWLRDSTYTLQALISAGYLAEAKAWREWLLRADRRRPGRLQIMYALDGTRRIPEAELPWLAGYENSRPVRTGNAASDQLQLDVWGEILDGLALARNAGISTHDDAWDMQVALMNHLEGTWDQPDNGLWEMRGPRRHFTHSKVLAWVAADRMATAVRAHHLYGPADRWEALGDTIHADVLAHGYNPDRNTFTQSYDAPGLDAALLMIPRVGFLPPDDSRVLGTSRPSRTNSPKAVRQTVRAQHLRRRTARWGRPLPCLLLGSSTPYTHRPPQPKQPNYSTTARSAQRRRTAQRTMGPARPQRQLGNTPQAFSHFPLTGHRALQQPGQHRDDVALHHSNHPITPPG